MIERDGRNLGDEAKSLLRLGGPLIVNNLAVAGMQFADAVMAGQLGADSLAAVAVGGSVWMLGFSFCLGLLMAISPIVARHFGAGTVGHVGRYTRQGIYLGLCMGLPLILIGQFVVGPLLETIGIDPEFRDLTTGYVGAIMFGAPGIFIFLALRFTTEGIGHTRPIMFTSIFALSCNVFLNYVLMFGKFGAPAMGAVGCGAASAISMWLVALVLAMHVLISKHYRPFKIFSRVAPLRLSVLKEIVSIGVPIAITITAEIGLFAAVSILMGTRGTEITAAHQIAINFASTMFMVPLALNSATTVRVGQLLGAGDPYGARTSGAVGISLCALFMGMSAMLLLVFRDLVVTLYTDDVAVKGIAVSLLLMAAIFQVADGVQIGAAGALRGYKDTRVPMAINMFAYWVLAFPLAFLAAITYKAPPNYVWGGFVVGLAAAAILLTWRFNRLSKSKLRTV
ncbi:MAG: MATE family efflux transporter [Gammaproteobacteria bacterium]|nr:MATE family efflux transporter [Gammaproteobacteria bacterium]MBU2676130.1 MATE family efflux transporter [Gammaproteobacteria bacterium]NNC57058.1 MATE family efflux transporter [Woeseiaceae bacterium]NNL49866.1 MATE family efflux transporter [Woeseiaceae bacterium]